TIVAVKAERRAAALVGRPIAAVDQQDVEPAVAIVVEKGAPGAQRFGQILRAECSAVMPEADSRARGDIGKAKGRGGGSEEGGDSTKERPARHEMVTNRLRIA